MRVLLLLLLPIAAVAGERIPVTVVERAPISSIATSNMASVNAHAQTNCFGSSCSTSVYGTARGPSQQMVYGAVLTLALPDGRYVKVRCDGRYAPRGNGINQRNCRVPPVNNISAEFNGRGTKVQLYWPASIDGRKLEHEKYDFVALVEKP